MSESVTDDLGLRSTYGLSRERFTTSRDGITVTFQCGGALQYYSRFIPNFAKHASCLFEVISANQFSWFSKHKKKLRALPGHLQLFRSDFPPNIIRPSLLMVLALEQQQSSNSDMLLMAFCLSERNFKATDHYRFAVCYRFTRGKRRNRTLPYFGVL
ncbi:hypothetical protein CLF_112096 [Clonorchis sinensis]|uniref:Uncharacterized protein n=1 Tax=Clonorchis sinensis TaxID=79923 RepID=G7YM93_CLOSI|nr:hypothetical protein CLF_112096 [Clonorchis sinensis]